MKFFNNRKDSFLFRVNGLVSIVVKPNTLSESVNYFNLTKHKVKYLFGNFPILFENENEKRRFDRMMIPYVLYKGEEAKKKVERVAQLSPKVYINMENPSERDRFVEVKSSDVDADKLPDFNENKEVEVLHPKNLMKDVVEDVESGDLGRILSNFSEDQAEEKEVDLVKNPCEETPVQKKNAKKSKKSLQQDEEKATEMLLALDSRLK